MRYPFAILSVIGLIIGIFIGNVLSSPTTAQNSTDDRIAALEKQIVEQDARLDVIEERLSALEGSGSANDGETVAPPSGDAIVVSGVGSVVSEDFQLSAGRYQVTAEVDVVDFDGFAIYIYAPGGEEDLLFNEIIEGTQLFTGSVIFEASGEGTYFVEAQNTGSAWTLTFERR